MFKEMAFEQMKSTIRFVQITVISHTQDINLIWSADLNQFINERSYDNRSKFILFFIWFLLITQTIATMANP